MPDNFGLVDTVLDVGSWLYDRFTDKPDPTPRYDQPGGNMASTNGRIPVRNDIMPAVFGRDQDGTLDWNPFPDSDDLPSYTRANGCQLQVMVAPQQKTINKAPKGYVIVDHPSAIGPDGKPAKVAMLKAVARSCGLWKPRPKPLFTASDAKCIRRASRLQKKGDRLAKMLNSSGGNAPLRRTRGKR